MKLPPSNPYLPIVFQSQRSRPSGRTAQWLEEINPALGGKAPGEFLDTADGRELVSRLIAQMQSGAYA